MTEVEAAIHDALRLGAIGLLLVLLFAITATIPASAEVERMVQFIKIPLGIALLATPFEYEPDWLGLASNVISAAPLIGMGFRPGPVKNCYGGWNRLVV